MSRSRSLAFLASLSLLSALSACHRGASSTDGGVDGGDDGGETPATVLSTIPLDETVQNAALQGPVDLVRDEWGIPHIYGADKNDVAFAEGYVMAMDRMVFMDLLRHQADGTLAELVGGLSEDIIDSDIQMRVHHLRATAQKAYDELQASTDPKDVALVTLIQRFADGVNAYIDELQSHERTLPGALNLLYDPSTTKPWTPVDEMLLGQFQAYELSFDADSDLLRTRVLAAAKMNFDDSSDPARKLRTGLGDDLTLMAPVDKTHTIDGWTGMNGDGSTASLLRDMPGNLLAALDGAIPGVRGLGHDHYTVPEIGSNNWIVGPSLSQSGNVLVANDTHLQLINPSVFYLVHMKTLDADPFEMMGVQFAGLPGIVLGMNRHIAWGATVSYIDVTDNYVESIVPCDDDDTKPCAMFNGGKVALVPRVEKIGVGRFGKIDKTIEVTLYDVPHHGPIIPRIGANHTVEALGDTEISIKYTGYEPAQILRAVLGVTAAKNVDEAKAALDRDFKYGGQNWVIGDDQGHFGWTQTTRVPLRAPGHPPYLALPGDGSAEWGADMDPKYIPHAWSPEKGYLATANADPIGVSDDGDPFNEPTVDGAPLYLGCDYDPGTRVGRITKRIEALKTAGKKLTLDDLQSIQADAVTEWGELLAPTLVDAGTQLKEELATPGTHPALTQVAQGMSDGAKANLAAALTALQGWSYDTPSAVDEDQPTADQVRDSQATAIYNAWFGRFERGAVGDELSVLGQSVDGDKVRKLLVAMCNGPGSLATGVVSIDGKDESVLFDDLRTADVTETKAQVAAQALVGALDFLAGKLGADPTGWRWGKLHTITLDFPLPLDALAIPLPSDPKYADGFPRHGDTGTVDVGGHGFDDDYSYAHGPAIRFVAELTPNGPKARNALPGGEVFDPGSPHYRDQMELWRKNQTFDLAFEDADVIASAKREYDKNAIGRIRFEPAK